MKDHGEEFPGEGIWELLRELSESFGVSGFEQEVRHRIRESMEPIADQVLVDAFGNLHAVLNPQEAFTVMLEAHMDEVGMVVRSIEEGGFLRLAPLGGWDPSLLPGRTVEIRARDGKIHRGVVGSVPPHIQEDKDRRGPLRWEQLFADIGARDAEEVRQMGIRVGSPALLPQTLFTVRDGVMVGKALDDRAGCAILVMTMASLSRKRPAHRVVATFSCAEEVGTRGAQVAGRLWEPDLAVVVEGTAATDTPEIPAHQRGPHLGKGPVITAVDRSIIVPEWLVERILQAADSGGIPWQMKTPLVGSTDAGPIHTSGKGVPTAVLAVPCRYIHSPACLARDEDILNTQRLVEILARGAPGLLMGENRPAGPGAPGS